MRFDRRLNLVIPVDTTAGEVQVFSTPIGRPTFERYYRVLARAWSVVATMGGVASGPRVAAMELRQTAIDVGTWDDVGSDVGVQRGLLEEIRRLTNVLVPRSRDDGGGWEMIPLMDAVRAGTLDEEDLSE